MRDTLRTRQQRIRKLLGIERRVAIHMFKPICRIARGILQLQHLDRTSLLIPCQYGFEINIGFGQRRVEIDRILQRKFGARSNGEVRGVRRIA